PSEAGAPAAAAVDPAPQAAHACPRCWACLRCYCRAQRFDAGARRQAVDARMSRQDLPLAAHTARRDRALWMSRPFLRSGAEAIMRALHFKLLVCGQPSFRVIRDTLPQLAYEPGMERGFVISKE